MNAIPPAAPAAAPAGDAERYGIVRVPTEHFEYGGYRYTNLADAVAAAKRGASGRGM